MILGVEEVEPVIEEIVSEQLTVILIMTPFMLLTKVFLMEKVVILLPEVVT